MTHTRWPALLALLILGAPTSWSQSCGDCSGDGSTSVLDALVAAQIGVGLLAPTPAQQQVCDVNSSLTVEVLDALLIAQVAAGFGTILTCPPPPVEPEWVRSAGTAGYDRGAAVASVGDVIYLAGTRDFVSGATADAWIMARQTDGSSLWEVRLQEPGGGQLELHAIATDAGAIHVGGVRRRFQPPAPYEDDLLILTLDPAGTVLRQTQVVAPATHETLHSLTVLADGSLLVLAGTTPQQGSLAQAWILNLESTGTIRWQKKLEAPDGCHVARARERSPSGTYVVGATGAPGSGGFDAYGWLLSLDAAGNLLWHLEYVPLAAGNGFTDLHEDASGLWLVGYVCSSCFFTDDAWMVRTDAAGALASSTLFGNYHATFYDRFNRILSLPSGELAIVGSTETLGVTGRYVSLHLFGPAGAPLWTRAFGETPRFTQAFDGALTAAGAIAFTGTSNYVSSPSLSDAYFGKLLPGSTALDGCPSTWLLTEVPRDITGSTTVQVPAGVTETWTGASTMTPGLTVVSPSSSPVDAIHCTN